MNVSARTSAKWDAQLVCQCWFRLSTTICSPLFMHEPKKTWASGPSSVYGEHNCLNSNCECRVLRALWLPGLSASLYQSQMDLSGTNGELGLQVDLRIGSARQNDTLRVYLKAASINLKWPHRRGHCLLAGLQPQYLRQAFFDFIHCVVASLGRPLSTVAAA